MIKVFKTFGFRLLLTSYFLLLASCPVFAQWQTYPTNGNPNATYEPIPINGDAPASFISLEFIFSNILGLIVSFAGLAVFIMFLVGGYKYLLSGGDPKKAAEGAATLTWAVGGLIALLLIWFIFQFIKAFTGVDVTIFKIPS